MIHFLSEVVNSMRDSSRAKKIDESPGRQCFRSISISQDEKCGDFFPSLFVSLYASCIAKSFNNIGDAWKFYERFDLADEAGIKTIPPVRLEVEREDESDDGTKLRYVKGRVHALGSNWIRLLALRQWRYSLSQLVPEGGEVINIKPSLQVLTRGIEAHCTRGMEDHHRFRGTYYAYDHWVPQFAVLALTESEL